MEKNIGITSISLLLINTFPRLQFNNTVDNPIRLISTILSFVSLFNGASGIFKHLKYLQFQDREDPVSKYSWKSKCGIFLSFLMTIGPRLLILIFFFGICDSMEGLIGFSIFLLTYCITFSLPTVLMYQKIKATVSEKYFQNLLWAFISAPMSPCIVVHPRSKTFLISSVASALAHFALLIFANSIYMGFNNVDNLRYDLFRAYNHQEKRFGITILGTLMGLLLTSLMFSWILHFLSKGEIKSTCFSWCKSKISCCSKKHSGEETDDNESTEQNPNDLIAEIPADKCKCKCFNWFKCKKMCNSENSGDDSISLRYVHK